MLFILTLSLAFNDLIKAVIKNAFVNIIILKHIVIIFLDEINQMTKHFEKKRLFKNYTPFDWTQFS